MGMPEGIPGDRPLLVAANILLPSPLTAVSLPRLVAESVTLLNASKIEDVAFRTGSDALAFLCERLREHLLIGDDHNYNDDEFDL